MQIVTTSFSHNALAIGESGACLSFLLCLEHKVRVLCSKAAMRALQDDRLGRRTLHASSGIPATQSRRSTKAAI